jgi:hypothetical protein
MRHFRATLLLLATSATYTLADYFFYGPTCTGDRVVAVVTSYLKCYNLGSGYANSIQAVEGALLDLHVAFQPSSANHNCGYSVCHATQLSICCSSSSKNIKGLALYPSCTKNCQNEDTMAAPGNSNPPLAMGSEDECVSTKDIGEVEIELSDGSYYGLGVGAPPPKIEDLQRELAAAGKPTLTEAKIAQLREDGLIQ